MNKSRSGKKVRMAVIFIAVFLATLAILMLFRDDNRGSKAGDPQAESTTPAGAHGPGGATSKAAADDIDGQPPGDPFRGTSDDDLISGGGHERSEQSIGTEKAGEDQACGILGQVYVFGMPEKEVRICCSNVRSIFRAGEGAIETFSDAQGQFTFDGLGPARYLLTAIYYDDEATYSESTRLEVKDETTHCVIRIGESQFGTISGRVLCESDPLEGAIIRASHSSYRGGVSTDEKGFFCFPKVPAGRIRLEVWEVNDINNTTMLPFFEKTYFLEGGDELEDTFVFGCGTGVLTGKVIVNGEPLMVGSLTLKQVFAKDGRMLHDLVEVYRGKWRAEHLQEGRYHVIMTSPRPTRKAVDVVEGAEAGVDFVITTGDSIVQGLVHGDDIGRGSSDSFVFLFRPGTCALEVDNTFVRPSASDGLFAENQVRANGRFRFRNLPALEFDLVVIRVDRDKIAFIEIKRIALSGGDDVWIDFHMN